MLEVDSRMFLTPKCGPSYYFYCQCFTNSSLYSYQRGSESNCLVYDGESGPMRLPVEPEVNVDGTVRQKSSVCHK